MQDLELDKVYQKGSKGQKVKLIQEWLILNNFNLVIDGVFGPATEYAVRAFQKAHCLETDGVVRPDTNHHPIIQSFHQPGFSIVLIGSINRPINLAGLKFENETVTEPNQKRVQSLDFIDCKMFHLPLFYWPQLKQNG
jgi:peptidoglycan hydrolase-like protein with peptidoglycan-binding domain